MSLRSLQVVSVATCLIGLAGCSSSPPEATLAPPQTALPTTAGRGVAGSPSGTVSGAAGTSTSVSTVAGRPATTGSAGTVAPNGAGGTLSTTAGSGAAGARAAAAGGGAAGTAGTAAGAPSTLPAAGGAAPAAGGTAPAPAGSFIREADPTEASVKTKGEFKVMSYTEKMGLVGGTDYGDAATAGDGSELYYPVGTTPPYAAMVIVPGFTAQRSDIAPWAAFLASHGIVSLAIDTNTTADLPAVREMALVDALNSLKKENMREGSPIKGQIDTTVMGVMGWSMGGGGTWLTADSHPELKVAVSLCGWTTDTPGAMTKVPSLQLAVQDDQLAAGMSQPVYAAIPNSTPKMLVEWSSGGHWINNDPMNVNQQVGRFGLVWVKIYLEGDMRYRSLLKTMPMSSSDFKTNQM
jgi:dienelactone hydrolase